MIGHLERLEFFTEITKWPHQHLTNALAVFFILGSTSLTIFFGFAWETLEAISYIATSSYFIVFPRVSAEPYLDSLVGDPIQAIFAALLGIATMRAFHMRPLLRVPATRQENELRPPRMGPGLLAKQVSGHPRSHTTWNIVRAVILGIIWTLTAVPDWVFGGDIGFILGAATSAIAIVIGGLMFIRDRQTYPRISEWATFFGVWSFLVVLLAVPTAFPMFAYVGVNCTALLWVAVCLTLLRCESNSWAKVEEAPPICLPVAIDPGALQEVCSPVTRTS
ncbi:hypothetical protein J8273_5391 [Carpediemonas membranifera]|uniref:Uncharacterized protein n=1 Tax=Carpediemonas membranifera TaxID=201153 RepID=A0A8J6ARF7_9EUKA|nr:hypothetical protein J8273_5391 [Carpediemonas membranifera]|eukprot:KAG9392401.1 hypothetical protein J8273_5391 [Carpediemonas membranifera]